MKIRKVKKELKKIDKRGIRIYKLIQREEKRKQKVAKNLSKIGR